MSRTRLIMVAAVAIFAAVAGYVYFRPDPAPEVSPPPAPPPDPRVVFDTPFRNARPGVKYVGDAACAGCHADIDKAYHAHPMGRSALRAADPSTLERYDPAAHPTFAVKDFALTVRGTGPGAVHAMTAAGTTLPEYAVKADIGIGSGGRGRSFLTVDGDAVWQSPLSYFTKDGRWDVSPGYTLPADARRPIDAECLACHVNQVEAVPGSANRFRQPVLAGQLNIGCERCHGPGELHVREQEAGTPAAYPDYSIVNPKHLPADLKTAICMQCHLQGQSQVLRRGREPFDFRPGLPWEQFTTTFVRASGGDAYQKSVGQFEQMTASKCSTGGKLDCTSCHDPHEKPTPEKADAVYRARCLTCHETKRCSAPPPDRAARADNCVTCHMPKADSANIAHAAVTNHRVPRRPGAVTAKPAPPDPDEVPLKVFRPGPNAPPAAEIERDLGVALAKLAAALPPGQDVARSLLGRHAESRLLASTAAWPADAAAWHALGTVYAGRGNRPKLLSAAKTASGLAPENELYRASLADALLATGDFAAASQEADELIRMAPRTADHYLLRAETKMQVPDWPAAEADCRAALAIHPLLPRARLFLAACRANQNDPAGGTAELEHAVKLLPDDAAKAGYRDWYKRQVK